MCAIDSWSRNSLHPHGHWIEDLGPVDDLATECKVILREHDVITRDFPKVVLKCLPPDDYEISESEIAKRLDIRPKYCFCDTCRTKRNGGSIPGSDDPQLVEYIGTPCIYTKDINRAPPLKDWWKESDPTFSAISAKRKAFPKFEESDLGDPSCFSGTLCCSIDPYTCVDIDDSLSARFLKNGNYEVIHTQMQTCAL